MMPDLISTENAVAIVVSFVGNKGNVETPCISYFRIVFFFQALFHQVPLSCLFARRRPCTRTLRGRGFASQDTEKAKDSFDSFKDPGVLCKMRTK